MLTAERARELLRYNRRTGVLTWRVDVFCGRYYKQFAARKGQRAGNGTREGRIKISIDGGRYNAHRVIWLLVTGKWPPSEIDHRDQDPSNNAWRNLRLAHHSMNMQNERRARRNNKAGVLGVSARKNRFIAQITINGHNTYLGCFRTAREAHAVYVKAKRIHHVGCTL